MKVEKVFRFFKSQSDPGLTVIIHEHLDSADYAISTWPSAPYLASYLYSQPPAIVENRVVLELGAGTALPSITADRLDARSVYISERSEEPEILAAIAENIAVNQAQGVCQVLPFNWSDYHSILPTLPLVDLVLGADILYFEGNYPTLFEIINEIFTRNPEAIFLTSYQQRNVNLTIMPWLLRYSMKAEIIETDSFLNPAHDEGFCVVEKIASVGSALQEEEVHSLAAFDNILLIKITKAKYS